ncbi:hypothetical protein GGER_31330 [Serratia rubidaea]
MESGASNDFIGRGFLKNDGETTAEIGRRRRGSANNSALFFIIPADNPIPLTKYHLVSPPIGKRVPALPASA